MADLTGQSIGRYQILSRLGEGGMATVYKARDTRLDRDVALKLIRVDQFAPAMMDHVLARFEREAKSLARLSHNSIVRVYDYGEHDGAPYLVLEYCEGGDLKQRLLGKPMDWQEAVQLILPVARALRFSHQQGIIHRDVKPSNIMFNGSGEPMLSDFGIAKMLETNDAATLTGTGVGIGTPGYMAPEQWTGETSPQSDQYGLGVVLYEMLTGRKPYESDTPAGILIKQTSQPLPLPSKFVPAIPPEVEIALLKSLDRDPAVRYADMGAFIKAFEGLLQQTPVVESKPGVVAAPPPPTDTYKTLDLVVTEDKPTPVTPADWATSADPLPKRKPINWKQIVIGGAALVVLAGVVWGGWQLSTGGIFVPELSAMPTRTLPPHILTPSATSTPRPTNTPAATATPTLGIGSTLTREQDAMEMVYVPAGDFKMGSSESGVSHESPFHTVYLDEYWIDQTEVTNGMYAMCVEAGKCTPPRDTSSYSRSSYYGEGQYDAYPVIFVDWNQAKAYCDWAGADLPTEAQWEKAARGTEGGIYPWGDASPSSNLLNYNGIVGDTTEAGSYLDGISPYGTLDMAGNVWEWVNDWYDHNYYQDSPVENPQGPSSGSSKVLRGGSWYRDNTRDVRSASRLGWYDPSSTYIYFGFRCASSVPPATAPAASTPQPTPAPVANAWPEEITDDKGVTMRLVPAGPFIMGSDADAEAVAECKKYYSRCDKSWLINEEPTHTVTLDDYYVDVYEVTNALYNACVNAGYCTVPNNSSYGISSVANFPVTHVDWNQAKSYCEWRGARLPTEAEWEKAARGTDGRTYPWGEGINCNQANHYDSIESKDCVGNITKVGSYESGKSPYGMYDMAGNVSEWVNDLYDSEYYQNSPTENPQGPSSGSARVLRGGAWGYAGAFVRSVNRGMNNPSYNYSGIGFRCSSSVPPATAPAASTLQTTPAPTMTINTLAGVANIACGKGISFQKPATTGQNLELRWDNNGVPGDLVLLSPLEFAKGVDGLSNARISYDRNGWANIDISGLVPDTPCAIYWPANGGFAGSIIPYDVIVGGKVEQGIRLWGELQNGSDRPDGLYFFIEEPPTLVPLPKTP